MKCSNCWQKNSALFSLKLKLQWGVLYFKCQSPITVTIILHHQKPNFKCLIMPFNNGRNDNVLTEKPFILIFDNPSDWYFVSDANVFNPSDFHFATKPGLMDSLPTFLKYQFECYFRDYKGYSMALGGGEGTRKSCMHISGV